MRLKLLLCFFVSGLCSFVNAQLANTTSLVGAVSDSAGASMAGVTVTAVNTGTQDTYTVKTNADGNYTIAFLKIGTYNITATQSGFQTIQKNQITVDYNQTVRADFTLAVGQVSQKIEVTAATPPISTDDASVKEVIPQQAIADLPLNGRDPLQLATTAPGILPGQKGTNGVPPGEDFIAAGTREIQNSVSLDGIAIMNNLITTVPFHPSPDAVQEVEAQSGTYSAQYGGYLGAHLNVITKNGTNSLHGGLWEFYSSQKLDARNFFLSPTAVKPPLHQNQFGLEFGGPVIIPKLYDGRNKTFFMVDYEGLRQLKSANSVTSVLTPLMRTGNFSQLTTSLKSVNGQAFPGNIIPASSLSPAALKLLAYMPAVNVPGTVNGTANNYSAIYPNNDTYNQNIERIDQNVGNNIRLFFRYAWNNENFVTGSASPTGYTYIPVQTRNWVGGYTQTITPNMVNDIRVGRQHLVTNALNNFYTSGLTHAGSDLGIPGFTGDVTYNNPGIPNIGITGFSGFGNAATNWFQYDTTWQGTDSLTYTHGHHTFIVGAEVRKLITSRSAVNNADGLFSFSGALSGNAAADFLLGYAISDQSPGPQIRNQVAEWRDGFFFVDNWQATKRLTLNLGIRYELPTVPYTTNGYATILNATQTALIPSTLPSPGFGFTNPNHKNFAPRFGLAYRLTDKTVIRAGYGIYYNPNQTNSFTFLSVNPPLGLVTTYNTVYTTTTAATTASSLVSFANPFPGSGTTAALSNTTIYTPNPSLPTQYMNQWSFDIQQGIWQNGALDIAYLGSRSVHLDRSYYLNTPLPGSSASVASRRPNKLFGDIRQIQNDENSHYEGITFELRQRLSHGISITSHYTFSHTLDAGSDSNGGGAPQDPYNWRGDYSNANWDVRHRFVTTFNYSLPFFLQSSNGILKQTLGGWQTNGIVNLQSGFPFNVVETSDFANTGRSNERPNLIGTPSSTCGRGSLVNCISSAAYANSIYAYGNAGRNMLYGPGLYNVNFSAFKNFSIAERAKLQFRAEFFNLFNTAALSNPNATFGSSVFGSITSTKADNRDIQFALKLLF